MSSCNISVPEKECLYLRHYRDGLLAILFTLLTVCQFYSYTILACKLHVLLQNLHLVLESLVPGVNSMILILTDITNIICFWHWWHLIWFCLCSALKFSTGISKGIQRKSKSSHVHTNTHTLKWQKIIVLFVLFVKFSFWNYGSIFLDLFFILVKSRLNKYFKT